MQLFAKALSHVSTRASSARAYSLTGPLSVFPHSTRGQFPPDKGVFKDQLLTREFLHLGVEGGGGVVSTRGPRHLPSHRTPEMIERNVRTYNYSLCKFPFARIVFYLAIYLHLY